MIPLAIWVLLIGYTVAWTGRMNWGLRYEPQADGTIKAVDADGKPARTWSLTDALTGAPQATGATPGGRTQAGTPTVGAQPGPRTGDCAPRAGDVKIGPFIWRPQKLLQNEPSYQTIIIGGLRRVVDTANGQLVGPC